MLEAPQETNSQRRLNWSQILLTALVTGVVTIVTGVILSKLQVHEPSLVYSTVETIPFAGQNQVVGIYQVSISNEGNKEVEEVDAFIRVIGAKIEQRRVSAAPTLAFSDELKTDSITLHFPRINPSETVQLSILATAPAELPRRSEVALRARGLSGKEKTNDEKEKFGTVFAAVLTALVGATAGLSSFFMRAVGRSKRDLAAALTRIQSGKHSGNQRHVLAYLCDLHGLYDEAERYRTLNAEAQYWSESDRLSTVFLNCSDAKRKESVRRVLDDLLDYASIASDSADIINLNLARICHACGLQDEARSYLAHATAKGDELVKTRVRLDPILRSISESANKLSSKS